MEKMDTGHHHIVTDEKKSPLKLNSPQSATMPAKFPVERSEREKALTEERVAILDFGAQYGKARKIKIPAPEMPRQKIPLLIFLKNEEKSEISLSPFPWFLLVVTQLPDYYTIYHYSKKAIFIFKNS